MGSNPTSPTNIKILNSMKEKAIKIAFRILVVVGIAVAIGCLELAVDVKSSVMDNFKFSIVLFLLFWILNKDKK